MIKNFHIYLQTINEALGVLKNDVDLLVHQIDSQGKILNILMMLVNLSMSISFN